jgi:hypothetical protein
MPDAYSERKSESSLLADQEDIDGTEIEFVVERERRETLICRMHTSIKL